MQMDVFQQEARRRAVAEMQQRLLAEFRAELQAVPHDELAASISRAIDNAAEFEIGTEQDCYRFLTLCVELGWSFVEAPENAWMKEILASRRVTDPAARLHLLERWRVRRRRVREANRAAAIAFGKGA